MSTTKAATSTEWETFVVEHEDARPPCDSVTADGAPFHPVPATWIMDAHCTGCAVGKVSLKCDDCKELATSGQMIHNTCRSYIRVKSAVRF